MSDNRSNRRITFSHPLQVGLPGKKDWLTAETLNHCAEGICFKSKKPFHPGCGIMLRIVNWNLKGASPESYRGLKGVAMAEVKWCRPLTGDADTAYKVGAGYYPSCY